MWKWLTQDVDMSKRRNKILSACAVLVAATIAWIYLLPVLSPSGSWIAQDKESGTTAYISVHENATTPGYTVLELTYTPITEGTLRENLNTQGKSNLVTAWAWRLQTLHQYSRIEPASQEMTLDELRQRAADIKT